MDAQLKNVLEENNVNIEKTLGRFMNNEALFERFLYKFFEDKNFIGLKESLEKKDYDEAYKFSHTLKGVSANLGLDSIYLPVCKLVEELRSKGIHEIPADIFVEIEKNYDKLKNDIQQLSESL